MDVDRCESKADLPSLNYTIACSSLSFILSFISLMYTVNNAHYNNSHLQGSNTLLSFYGLKHSYHTKGDFTLHPYAPWNFKIVTFNGKLQKLMQSLKKTVIILFSVCELTGFTIFLEIICNPILHSHFLCKKQVPVR